MVLSVNGLLMVVCCECPAQDGLGRKREGGEKKKHTEMLRRAGFTIVVYIIVFVI